MKTLLLISITAALLTGCVSVKEATIENATINTSGWKSQSGTGGDAIIEATTTPSTRVSAAGL